MVQIHRKLTGNELNILRHECKINAIMIAKITGISINDLMIYEQSEDEIPDEIYNKWIEVMKPLIY